MSAQVRPIFLALALALAACAAPPARDTAQPPDERAAERLADAGRPADAASVYQRVADRAALAEAARLRVRAAELWLRAGDNERARDALSRVDLASLDDHDTQLARILSAELALREGLPADALRIAPSADRRLSRDLAARARRIHGDAYLLLGQARAAVASFVARDALLDDAEAIAENHRAIWSALRQVDDAHEPSGDRTLDGWLALAELRRRAWQDPWRFEDALRAWRRDYPGHPAAASFIPQLVDEQQRLAVGVREVAVLLPLSGRFASAGEAVRDGFLSALYRTPADARRPIVKFYDVGDDPAVAPARYAEAVQAGADFVVGPLQKEAVAALAASARTFDVPVLALNTLDHGESPAGFYTYGLVPEDEAVQIADRVALEGHERALALVPDSELGARMLAAFTAQFEQHGGRVLAVQWYDPRQRDHSAAITRVLSIDESRARLSTLRVVLQANLQSEPRRRRDADFVFIVATPQQGRSLRPQLRFHHASDLPVYASSHVYTGIVDRTADADLDGVAFTDMPWSIAPDRMTADVRDVLLETFRAEMERNSRLFAFGYDAFRLAPVLRHDPSLLAEPMPAATGALSLGDDGRIQRTLTWARFRGGIPRPLEPPVVESADGAVPPP